MIDSEGPEVSRRDLLRSATLGAAGLALGGAAGAQGARIERKGVYGHFSMALQSYTLRAFSFEEALDKTKRLGLEYWEATQSHVPQTDSPSKLREIRQRFESLGIQLVGWGVQGFDGDIDKGRKTFEFARQLGIKVITADPTPEALPVLDRLLEEYRKPAIFVGIHNHGPGARYDKISSVAKALKGHHERLGACIDTGHYLRSGEDPVEAVKTFGKRVYDVHLKDVRNRTQFTILGQGDLRTTDLFRELNRLNYDGLMALEYEEHPEDPTIDIDLCLAATRAAVETARYKK